jgi:ComF family protein
MEPPAGSLVHALKYGGWRELAPTMAQGMVRALGSVDLAADAAVAPVPTTRARLRARGYNQAEELSRAVARSLDLVHLNPLRREGDSGTQVALHRHERRANVEQAFRPGEGVGSKVAGRYIVLVDDVLTTGATACAAAAALGSMGVSKVTLLTFARALPDEDGG